MATDGHNLVVTEIRALKEAADGLMAKIVPTKVEEVLVCHHVAPSVAEGSRRLDWKHGALAQDSNILGQQGLECGDSPGGERHSAWTLILGARQIAVGVLGIQLDPIPGQAGEFRLTHGRFQADDDGRLQPGARAGCAGFQHPGLLVLAVLVGVNVQAPITARSKGRTDLLADGVGEFDLQGEGDVDVDLRQGVEAMNDGLSGAAFLIHRLISPIDQIPGLERDQGPGGELRIDPVFQLGELVLGMLALGHALARRRIDRRDAIHEPFAGLRYRLGASLLAVHILITDDLPLLDLRPILGLLEGFEGFGQGDRLAARLPADAGSKLMGAALVNGRHFRLRNRKPGGHAGPPLVH